MATLHLWQHSIPHYSNFCARTWPFFGTFFKNMFLHAYYGCHTTKHETKGSGTGGVAGATVSTRVLQKNSGFDKWSCLLQDNSCLLQGCRLEETGALVEMMPPSTHCVQEFFIYSSSHFSLQAFRLIWTKREVIEERNIAEALVLFNWSAVELAVLYAWWDVNGMLNSRDQSWNGAISYMSSRARSFFKTIALLSLSLATIQYVQACLNIDREKEIYQARSTIGPQGTKSRATFANAGKSNVESSF